MRSRWVVKKCSSAKRGIDLGEAHKKQFSLDSENKRANYTTPQPAIKRWWDYRLETSSRSQLKCRLSDETQIFWWQPQTERKQIGGCDDDSVACVIFIHQVDHCVYHGSELCTYHKQHIYVCHMRSSLMFSPSCPLHMRMMHLVSTWFNITRRVAAAVALAS